jgi:hypothetical protein
MIDREDRRANRPAAEPLAITDAQGTRRYSLGSACVDYPFFSLYS